MKKKIIGAIIFVGIIAILLFVDIPRFISKLSCLSIFKNNLYWIERIFDTFTPLLVMILISMFILWAKTHLSITITRCSIGGIEVNLKDTEDEVKNNVRNFLNTKRTLFKIIPEYDNFYDVFNSYHEIYEFLRIQLGLFTSPNKKSSDTYKTIQNTLKELNCFLTKYQSDYRRWYEKEIEKEFVPLYKLQRNYFKYNEIVEAFIKINKRMTCLAEKFGVDTFLYNDLGLEKTVEESLEDKERKQK